MSNNEAIKILEIIAMKSVHWPKEAEAIKMAITALEGEEKK